MRIPTPSNPPRSDEAGFTFLEIMVSMVIVSIGILAITVTLANGSSTGRALSERQMAMQAALDFMEEVKATDFDSIYASYRPGGTIGPTFFVPIFEQTTVGRIDFIIDETTTDPELPMALGFPRDLDGDGIASNPDVSLAPQVLIAIVTVTWGRADSPQTWTAPLVVRRTS